ncbi:UbiA family prenyltransferase [Bdellovibrio bacteriovorus]
MSQYLVCDLDECLIKTDALYEQWIVLLKKNPLLFLLSFFWILKGRAFFKHQISKHTSFNAAILPYRDEVIAYIKDYRSSGKGSVILASASPLAWVQAVSNHLGIFDQVIGSNEIHNLKSDKKLQALQEKIGTASFSYIGDHFADLPLWKQSEEVIAVNPNKPLEIKIRKLGKPVIVIKDLSHPWKLLIKQIRPHQWVKNALVFLPALAGHKLFQDQYFLKCSLAFVSFSLAASFVYVLNDILDLSSDRNHHTKRKRPFASGNLPIRWGLFLLPILLLGSLAFATTLPMQFAGWIATYLILNLGYSFYLKQSVIVDIIILSLMYTMRIFAGSAASSVPVSEWLLSFSTLFFFSLACVKRYTEISRSKNKITLDGRGYRQVDHSMVQSLGVGSGLLSILIILLYLQGAEVRALYSNPQGLWYATPILLFWISRIWLLTNRDEIHDDPVVFAVKDKVSWACLILLAIVSAVSL